MQRRDAVLDVRDLRTSFFTPHGEVRAVDGVSFTVAPGECVAIVGESGSGKSVTALSIMRLVPAPGRIVGGEAWFGGRDLLRLPEHEMERIRGRELAMVFQDPMTSLNPVLTIGRQVTEVLEWHGRMSRAAARRRAVELLAAVGIPQPERRLHQYPHQFSGGMRQRVCIAIALAMEPRLLIADEPTTALDVTIQAQILDLLRDLKRRRATSIVLITHDLGVVAGLADRVLVMYAGRIVEEGPVDDIFARPRHPYTWGLLHSVPRLDDEGRRRLVPIGGQPPDLLSPPPGCRFHPRCRWAMRICAQRDPQLAAVDAAAAAEEMLAPRPAADPHEHRAACWLLHPQAPGREGMPA